MGYTDRPDSQAIYEAKRDLRSAAKNVRECPHCAEGWREVEGGVVRCECWTRYENAWKTLKNLDSDFFVEDSFTDLATRCQPPFVAVEQIRSFRLDLERMANAKGEL